MILIKPDSYESYVKKEAGGKGFNLHRMHNLGLRVPVFRILGRSIFEEFLTQNNLAQTIQSILDSNISDDDKSHKIEEIICNTSLSQTLENLIAVAHRELQGQMISVRSSAADEDSGQHSFAGQLSSFLYLKSISEIISAVKRCWASGFTSRSLTYRKQNSLSLFPSVAVILQVMIDPDTSGVLFTCDPIQKSNTRMMINSVYGVGEGLVSGLFEGDSFTIDYENGAMIESNIASKEEKLTFNKSEEGPVKVGVPQELQNVASLNESELSQLHLLGKKLEEAYHRPQDAEWAFKDGTLYILQTRPVTTSVPAREGTLYIWDNSNIVESYGGLTLPLTFGFAHYVYHQVYVQFCEILMVPGKQIKAMNYFLKNMLGLFYGRVYYNLLNWYKLTSILPGYKYNRSFMETMMGTNTSLQDEIAQRVRPPAFQDTLVGRFLKLLTGLKFLYFHFTIQNVVDQFMKYFYSVYNVYKKKNYRTLESSAIYADYQDLEEKLLWRWHAPIINDYLCMVHFGIFKALTKKWLSHLGDNFQNDLLAGDGNLESAQPTKDMIKLAALASANEDLKKLIITTPTDRIMECLRQSIHHEFYAKIQEYISLYGFRCMSEMKLEQKDFNQDPAILFSFLKNLINSGQIDLEKYEQREKDIRTNAEKLLNNSLNGIKKIVYSWSLHHARKAVRNRENTRFCRTRIYGIVRSMFFAIGADYTTRGIIDREEDIFYLTLEELKGSLEGTNAVMNLKKLIDVRKSEYAIFNEQTPDSRFHTRGPCYWQNIHWQENEELPDLEGEEFDLRGLACCPGVVEGKVKVIMGPEDDMELNGEILVTMRTDPGWIPLYPSASALLVERGGLLSHSAIVAREMGLPTIVSIKGLTKTLKTGMKIRIDGEKGIITILEG